MFLTPFSGDMESTFIHDMARSSNLIAILKSNSDVCSKAVDVVQRYHKDANRSTARTFILSDDAHASEDVSLSERTTFLPSQELMGAFQNQCADDVMQRLRSPTQKFWRIRNTAIQGIEYRTAPQRTDGSPSYHHTSGAHAFVRIDGVEHVVQIVDILATGSVGGENQNPDTPVEIYLTVHKIDHVVNLPFLDVYRYYDFGCLMATTLDQRTHVVAKADVICPALITGVVIQERQLCHVRPYNKVCTSPCL